MDIKECLMNHPVIAAVKTDEIRLSECEVYFILEGRLGELKAAVEGLKAENKMIFVHIDLIKGIKADVAGLEFLKSYINPTGIITTNQRLISEAKKIGLQTILRLFLLDSKNLKSGIQMIHKCQPDAVEILPGALHKVTEMIVRESKGPVITGGLIMDKDDVIGSLKVGAMGVSTSNASLWSI